jgi:hypothetical protein
MVLPVPPRVAHAPASMSTRLTPDVAVAMDAKRTEPHVEDVKYTP